MWLACNHRWCRKLKQGGGGGSLENNVRSKKKVSCHRPSVSRFLSVTGRVRSGRFRRCWNITGLAGSPTRPDPTRPDPTRPDSTYVAGPNGYFCSRLSSGRWREAGGGGRNLTLNLTQSLLLTAVRQFLVVFYLQFSINLFTCVPIGVQWMPTHCLLCTGRAPNPTAVLHCCEEHVPGAWYTNGR